MPALEWSRARRLLALAALAGAVAIGMYQSHWGFRGIGDDFITRYAAAEVAAEGDSPYDPVVLGQRELELGATGPVRSYDPPIFTAAFRVLTPLPLEAAAFVVNAASLAVVALLGWWVARHRGPMVLALAVVGVLIASPTRFALSLGAPDIVVLGAVVLLAHHQPVVGLLKPQTGGVVAAGSFASGPRPFAVRRLAIGLAGAVVAFALTALLAPGATWPDWVDALGERPESRGDLWVVQVLLAAAALLVLAWGVYRSRTLGRRLDLIALACASASIFAVIGHWNGYWHLAHVLPIGALLLAARDEGTLSRPHAVLLLMATAAAVGDAYTPNSDYGTFNPAIPTLAVAGVAFALIVLEEISVLFGVVAVVLNAAITLAPLSVPDRAIVPMAVGVVVTYLLFALEPDPIPSDLSDARGDRIDMG